MSELSEKFKAAWSMDRIDERLPDLGGAVEKCVEALQLLARGEWGTANDVFQISQEALATLAKTLGE